MPIVRIDYTGPRDDAYVSALMRGVRQAITSTLGATDDRVAIRAYEASPAHTDMPSCRTLQETVVDVMLYAGRTAEQKSACVASIRRSFSENPGIAPSEVAVAFHDMTPEDLDVLPGEAQA